MKPYKISIDTREKNPLFQVSNIETEIKKLDTGDYSISGFENSLAIEYKGSFSDWAGTCSTDRWKREVDRFDLIKNKHIIIVGSCTDMLKYPYGEKLSKSVKKRIRVNGKFMYRCLATLRDEKQIPFSFVDSRIDAELLILQIFDKFWEEK